MTFLTPFGRYRYIVAPQGHMVSGDGFNERYSGITSNFSNVERCVDDSVMWANNIQESFTQVCQYLDLCAKNGIILNPKKFQFCQDTVDFAGLQITNTNVRPSEKLLQSINEFPSPQDITGARAWFGLVNQASYAFAMTEEMACFRHLLKPKIKFEGTAELETQFTRSKEAIINKIIEGVHLFDPKLTTCLATDFSGTGIGYFLLQKACSCESKLPTCCPWLEIVSCREQVPPPRGDKIRTDRRRGPGRRLWAPPVQILHHGMRGPHSCHRPQASSPCFK